MLTVLSVSSLQGWTSRHLNVVARPRIDLTTQYTVGGVVVVTTRKPFGSRRTVPRSQGARLGVLTSPTYLTGGWEQVNPTGSHVIVHHTDK